MRSLLLLSPQGGIFRRDAGGGGGDGDGSDGDGGGGCWLWSWDGSTKLINSVIPGSHGNNITSRDRW